MTREPVWPELRAFLASARHRVEVLPKSRARGEATLAAIRQTGASSLGAIALETGGLLVAHGWLRILGSGSQRLRASLTNWNGLSVEQLVEPLPGALVVGFDVLGGIFALSSGGLPAIPPGEVGFLGAHARGWIGLGTYTSFLGWAADGDHAPLYAKQRWPGWAAEVAALDGDRGLHLQPPPRRVVPMRELWRRRRLIAPELRGD